MTGKQEITASTLQSWLEHDENIVVLDVRPKEQREEWQIPGSTYVDAYTRLNANDPSVLDEVAIPDGATVVTVCAAGRTSSIAANELRKKGIDAYSLDGGMKAWSLAWNTAKLSFPGFRLIQFRRTGKGCLSYMIASNNEAIIVDASLPVENYMEVLLKEKLTLKYVLETHLHADHLSRSKQLAENNNAALYLPVPNKVKFDFVPISNNSVFNIGTISFKPIQTPGHTIESTSYLVDEKVLLTGDTLFTNGVGRPDLKANNEEVIQRSKMLYKSLQMLLAFDKDIIVLPAHTSQPVAFDRIPIQATIGDIKKNVSMLQLTEAEFIDTILQHIPPTPANYLSIVEKNIEGDFSDINPVDLEAGANRCAIS